MRCAFFEGVLEALETHQTISLVLIAFALENMSRPCSASSGALWWGLKATINAPETGPEQFIPAFWHCEQVGVFSSHYSDQHREKELTKAGDLTFFFLERQKSHALLLAHDRAMFLRWL